MVRAGQSLPPLIIGARLTASLSQITWAMDLALTMRLPPSDNYEVGSVFEILRHNPDQLIACCVALCRHGQRCKVRALCKRYISKRLLEGERLGQGPM